MRGRWRMGKFTCVSCMLAVLLFTGCSKDSVPTETPLVPGTSTIITGTVKDSSGNPIDSAAIKVKYYFTAVAKQSAKTDPCSLVSFIASRITNGVQLNWTTEGENNALRWEIERSTMYDIDFVLIGIVDASGTISTPINYSYIDSTVAADSADYYRLCLIDGYGAGYYYNTVGLDPIAIYHDIYRTASPCPFSGSTAFIYSLACSSQVLLEIKQKDQTIRTLVNQLLVTGLHSVIWNGKDDNNVSLASGCFNAVLTITRHDSTINFSKPVFLNIVDGSSANINAYTDAKGAFSIHDIPLDSVFNMTDAMGTDLGNATVCDSVTIYAVKNGYTVINQTLVLSKNNSNTLDFILR